MRYSYHDSIATGGACDALQGHLRPHPVVNINRIVTMTRIQPVIHENRITRVHNRTEALYETQHSARTEMLPARSVMYGKTIQMGGYMPAPRVNTVYRYNTVEKVQNVTKYNDVEHTQYVRHINRHRIRHPRAAGDLHQRRNAHSRPPGILGQERVPARDQNAPGAYRSDKQSRSDELPTDTHAHEAYGHAE